MGLGLRQYFSTPPSADPLTGPRFLAGRLEEFRRFNVKGARKLANNFQTYVGNAPFHLAHMSTVDSSQMG